QGAVDVYPARFPAGGGGYGQSGQPGADGGKGIEPEPAPVELDVLDVGDPDPDRVGVHFLGVAGHDLEGDPFERDVLRPPDGKGRGPWGVVGGRGGGHPQDRRPGGVGRLVVRVRDGFHGQVLAGERDRVGQTGQIVGPAAAEEDLRLPGFDRGGERGGVVYRA